MPAPLKVLSGPRRGLSLAEHPTDRAAGSSPASNAAGAHERTEMSEIGSYRGGSQKTLNEINASVVLRSDKQ